MEFEEEFGIKELDETLDSLEAIDSKVAESESESKLELVEGEGDTLQEESTEIKFSVNDDDAESDTKIQH